jgi:hypothetical protein
MNVTNEKFLLVQLSDCRFISASSDCDFNPNCMGFRLVRQIHSENRVTEKQTKISLKFRLDRNIGD